MIAPESVPNLVLVGSVALFWATQDFAISCVVDRANRSPIVHNYLGLFAVLSAMPALGMVVILVWSFFHASWWEPFLDVGFGIMFVGPLIGWLTTLLGEFVFMISFVCMAALSAVLVFWALKFIG